MASRRSSIPSFSRALVTIIWSSSSWSALRKSPSRRARAARASVSPFVSAASTGVSRSAKSSCIARSSSEGSRRMSSSQRTPASLVRSSTCVMRSEEHTSELQSPCNLVCRLLLEKKKHTELHEHPAADPDQRDHRVTAVAYDVVVIGGGDTPICAARCLPEDSRRDALFLQSRPAV